MSVREDLPILPQAHSPRGLGTFLLSCALGGIIGGMAKVAGDRYNDMMVGIGIYLGLVFLVRVAIWTQAGQASWALRRRNYEKALRDAERAIAFFGRVPWLDRARAGLVGEMGLTTLTEQAHAHRVTALANLGSNDEATTAFAEMKTACPEAPSIEAVGYFLQNFQRRS
jgi:hypothetical protein